MSIICNVASGRAASSAAIADQFLSVREPLSSAVNDLLPRPPFASHASEYNSTDTPFKAPMPGPGTTLGRISLACPLASTAVFSVPEVQPPGAITPRPRRARYFLCARISA